jgi:hypothetical protein
VEEFVITNETVRLFATAMITITIAKATKIKRAITGLSERRH